MKKFKKLIPAFAMLLVSAIMLGSSTFAWFSMNNKVTADGMNVNAQSNTEYFVISDSNTLGTDKAKGASKTAGGISDGNTAIYPCSFSTAGLTIGETSINKESFYTCYSDTYNDPATDVTASKRTNASAVTTGDNKYMYTYKVWVGLSEKSGASVNRKVKMTATITGNAALVVVFNEKTFVLKTGTENAKTSDSIAFAPNVAHEVIMYVYIDGESRDVKDDATGLTGTVKVDFDFIAE